MFKNPVQIRSVNKATYVQFRNKIFQIFQRFRFRNNPVFLTRRFYLKIKLKERLNLNIDEATAL